MKRHEEHEKNTSERWLLSYADFITLLMIFFLVMYSMSRLDAAKFEQLSEALFKSLNGTQYIINGSQGPSLISGESAGKTLPTPSGSIDQNNFSDIQQMLNEFIEQNGLDGTVSHYVDDRGLVVSLNNAAIFDSGSAELHAYQMNIVKKIGEMLLKLPNYIRVEGHTDNRPINNARFPSNWELSVLRATSVVQVFIKDVGIAPDKISAIGFGEYRPIAPNDSEANMKLNRRVDIVIMKTEYNKWEPNLGQGTPLLN
ncbi:MAG: flagellar motor protein MotB [Dehalobacterium sp.]